jgi:glycosyltransferase involved in cell wall biosynthesis
MSIWRDDGPVRKLARKLPPWVKRLARRLLGVAEKISRRFSTPKADGIQFPTAGLIFGRETVLVIVHEGTRTGAPILAWNLVRDLRVTYNVVVLLRRGGPLLAAFEAIASAVICLPDDFPMQPYEIEVLARQIYGNYAPKYAIANSVESRFIVAELEALSIPVVALVHEFSSAYRPVGILYGLFKSASAIVFSAQIVADSAVADYKILQARDFKILPQGPSKLPFITSNNRREPASSISKKRSPGSSSREFCVIGIGTITMRKGVDLFIAAAAAAKRMLPDQNIRFAWVGAHYWFDQPYFDALKQQLDESGLNDDAFELLGELDDLDPVYDRADVFFLSSRLDPLPNVAIDSALRGLPVVCFDQTSGIAELLLKHDETRGLVVPHLDSTAAAELICSLATDPVKLGGFSTAVAEIARQHFNMENYVTKIDELGIRARQSLEQIKEDQKIILQRSAFNSDLCFGYDSMSIDAGVWKYLADSRLAAPWNKPLAGTFMRRPLEGFNPLIYACESPGFDPQRLEDPLAHFARSGRPSGRWTHRVIAPAANNAAPIEPGKIAVHGHFHYPELLPDFIRRLRQNRHAFDLFLTTTTQAKADEIASAVAKFELGKVEIAVGSNRGRDLAPFLRGLRDGLYSGYDVVGHFHGKRSPHVESTTGDNWRRFLWEHLVGGEFAMADAILRVFAEEPRVGLVFAEDPHLNGWDENLKIAEALATRMKLRGPLPMHFDFPIGTMFWARPAALKPLIRLNLEDDDFPAEPLPIDGTLLHTLERIIPFAAAEAGFEYATTYVRNSKR